MLIDNKYYVQKVLCKIFNHFRAKLIPLFLQQNRGPEKERSDCLKVSASTEYCYDVDSLCRYNV